MTASHFLRHELDAVMTLDMGLGESTEAACEAAEAVGLPWHSIELSLSDDELMLYASPERLAVMMVTCASMAGASVVVLAGPERADRPLIEAVGRSLGVHVHWPLAQQSTSDVIRVAMAAGAPGGMSEAQ